MSGFYLTEDEKSSSLKAHAFSPAFGRPDTSMKLLYIGPRSNIFS